MKPGYLRYGGLLLLSAILGGCAASPPAQNTARLAPLSPTTRPMAQFMLSDMVRGSDIGLTRGVVAVDIPAGHKLMVLYRIYHNQQLDEKNPLAYFIYFPAKGGRGKYNVELSLFDPDLINPQPTDQIRLMPPSPGRWLTVKDKHAGKWMGFSLSSSSYELMTRRNYMVFDWYLGSAIANHHADGNETPATPPEWRVTVTVRLEPLTPKEAKQRRENDGSQVKSDPPEAFPLDGDNKDWHL